MEAKMNDFRKKVLEIVSQIPKGRVLTYKKVAELAGRPCAYRVVGNILAKNYNPKIPCHRVVRSNGRLGGYNRGAEKKKLLLRQDGFLLRTPNERGVLRGFPQLKIAWGD